MNNASEVQTNFFQDLYRIDFFKGLSVLYCSLIILILTPLLGGIIWFEKFGSDRKRTLINMIVSSICWTAIQCGVTVQLLDIVRHLVGPLPHPICMAQAIFRSSITSDFLLYYDAIIIVRFIYIFILKNPAAFQDEFWIRFLNIGIKSYSLIFQSVWHLTAKRQPISFYICAGIDPSSDDQNTVRVYGIIESISFLLHVVILSRIRMFKRNQKIGPETLNYFRKGLFLADINSHALSTNAISLANILLMCVTGFNVFTMNRMDPKSLNQPYFDHYVYFALLVSPPTLSLFAVVLYYRSNEALTKDMRNLATEWWNKASQSS